MNRATRRAVSAAVIGLALGLVTGLPPWPERTVTVTISLLLLAAAAVAAMWALLTIDEGLVPEPAPEAEVPDGEPAPDAPATARIHHLDLDELAQLASCHTLVYRAVADVPTADPETAFEMSQNLESPWAAGDRVSPLAGTNCRSTSVGDVIVIAGTLHIVRDVGFGVVASFEEALEEAHSSSFLGLYVSAHPRSILYHQLRTRAS